LNFRLIKNISEFWWFLTPAIGNSPLALGRSLQEGVRVCHSFLSLPLNRGA